MSVADLLVSAAAAHPGRTAIVEPRGETVTWGQLDEQVATAAGALRDAGVRTGDRVGIVLGNSMAFAVAYWATLRCGAVVVPVNPAYTAPEQAHIFTDADVRAVVADQRLASTVRAAAPEGAVVLEPADLQGDRRVGDVVEREAGEVAVLCYTSGTTGRPKGAMLSHGNLLANLDAFSDLPRLSLDADDVLLGVLPFFHIFGLNVILNASARAGAAVVALDRFSPTGSLQTLAALGVTVAYGAPPVFAAWCAVRDTPDLPRLRAAISGADALPVHVFHEFAQRFGLEICEGYGLTETAPVVASNAGSPEIRPGTVGYPVPGVDVRIVDPAGNPVAPGTEGEIVVRGDNVFEGYHGQPEATAEVCTDGWFATGDVGRCDLDGYLTIAGRLKDMLIVSGFNVYPREVEDVLLAHPKVAEAAVVGVPDSRTGERVRAVVVPVVGPGSGDLTVEDLLSHCRERLARYKLPRDIDIAESLPRTPLGKLARAALRGP
jgi:long-chain acyl-CoA synthetase